MKKIFLKLFCICFLFFLIGPQLITSNAAEKATTYGITFPITQLGNCANVVECKTYCNDSNNQSACVAFAKSKGFYKEKPATNQNELLTLAKQTLGCTSIPTCKVFCEQEVNKTKCRELSQNFQRKKTNTVRQGVNVQNGQGRENFLKYCQEHPDKCKELEPTPIIRTHQSEIEPTEHPENIETEVHPTGKVETEEVKGASTSNQDLLQTVMQVLSAVLNSTLSK